MKFKILQILLIAFLLFTSFQEEKSNKDNQDTNELVKNITWIDNACIKISGSKKLYFDPYKITKKDTADIVFVTHDHSDHFSLDDIEKVIGENTIIVGPQCVTESLDYKKRTIKPGDIIDIQGIQIQVIPSYTIKGYNHEKNYSYVGYIVTMDNISYYIPGDSDFIPEMEKIKTDIAFLPVCGFFMMNAKDAVNAATEINPKVVIPFHYGSVIGSEADALKFKELYSGVTVILKTE